MFRYIEIYNPAAIVSEDNEHEQHAQSHRGNGEEVDGHGVSHVLLQECAPRRRSRLVQLRAIFFHCRLGDINPELLKLGDNTRRAPGRIGLPHGRMGCRNSSEIAGRDVTYEHPKSKVEVSFTTNDDRWNDGFDARIVGPDPNEPTFSLENRLVQLVTRQVSVLPMVDDSARNGLLRCGRQICWRQICCRHCRRRQLVSGSNLHSDLDNNLARSAFPRTIEFAA